MPRTPSDATARLVFADWLTDRDDPRGEWLRVRTQLALGNGTAAELTHLEERERELAPTVLADWFALDLPVWCLLGGGLRYPPVPERLAEENVASWYGMSDFYAGLPEPWGYTRSLQQFVSAVAQTEIAKLFGAEQEDDEVTLIVLDTGFHTRGVYA